MKYFVEELYLDDYYGSELFGMDFGEATDDFVSAFKALFDRGQFSYGSTLPDTRDKDIEEAKEEALCVFNDGLIGEEECSEKAFLYLTAHFLQLDIQSADGSGQSTFLQTSRSADGISEAVHLPTWMRNSDFAMYTTTYYGQKFLMICKPYIDGGVFSVTGGTRF